MDFISFYFCLKHEMLPIINKKKFLIDESSLTRTGIQQTITNV